MRGINYRALNSNWMSIIEKLCDEKTPHDVLDVVVQHLENTKIMSEKLSMKSDNIINAIKEINRGIYHIKQGMRHIDPEG